MQLFILTVVFFDGCGVGGVRGATCCGAFVAGGSKSVEEAACRGVSREHLWGREGSIVE